MSIILNIETATKNCSVSLGKKGKLLVVKELNEEKFSHAEKLHSFILEVLKEAGLKMKDLDAIAISKGPGSYTGLRIGVSAAKGLCYALEKPLISISTLESMARQVPLEKGDVVVSMLDARRMEVYSAIFDHQYLQIRETKAEILEADSFTKILAAGNVYFVGDGAEKFNELIKHENAKFLSGIYPSAKEMAMMSNTKYVASDFEDVAYFEPFYLKNFVAGKPKKYFQ